MLPRGQGRGYYIISEEQIAFIFLTEHESKELNLGLVGSI